VDGLSGADLERLVVGVSADFTAHRRILVVQWTCRAERWHAGCKEFVERTAETGVEEDGMEPSKTESTARQEFSEGPVAREIEGQTARWPSDLWLWGAGASMVASLGLQFFRNRRVATLSNFLGQWVPTLLIFGLYNKLVKVAGHDRRS
jgi:hypothetical protein